MKKLFLLFILLFALPAWAGPARPSKAISKSKQTRASQTKKPDCKSAAPVSQAPTVHWVNEASKPAASDPDREPILRLQEALDGIVRGKVLGRLRVGMQVEELSSGRVLYGWRSGVLMDPASNQKVLATTAALLRLGSTFRYRTEVTGASPDAEGRIVSELVIRGSGDPSLRSRHLDALARSLAAQGVTQVKGDILGDPRRVGLQEFGQESRSPLRVGSTSVEIHVRPGEKVGSRPSVTIRPASDAFVVINQAETRGKGRGGLSVSLERIGNKFHVVVGGKIAITRGAVTLFRTPPDPPFYAAILLRQALIQAGIDVHGNAGIYSGENRSRLSSIDAIEGAMMALGPQASDSRVPMGSREPAKPVVLLALHESDPLPILLRRVNKDSDNEWAERVLETVGAEILGGAATTGKGLRVLRESLTELGVPASAYLPTNGSGLGHQNRVTAAGMAKLLRQLYFDPRIGPEIMQSLSVGGVDGTTRNRFRGSSAAHRVRAKTGTLNGVSCLSGFVGDGSDILSFSILVEGHKRRSVPNVRGAQVSAVNAMMRFSRRTAVALPGEDSAGGADYETGDEADENEVEPEGKEGLQGKKSELEHSFTPTS
jgi:D-alanyl-D-alanine carboxypeptidase/D-alanyl-D-alanine-endopeptidase (penicillin-binding protein 4)